MGADHNRLRGYEVTGLRGSLLPRNPKPRNPVTASEAELYELENMPQLLLLRLEILPRRQGRGDLERDAGDDLQAEAFDGHELRGVVGHQADLADAEVTENLGAGSVVADVGGEAELRVRLNRVVAFILQL